MTDEEIAARAAAADAGPWTAVESDGPEELYGEFVTINGPGGSEEEPKAALLIRRAGRWMEAQHRTEMEALDATYRAQAQANAAFIAAARADIPALLAEVQRLRAALTRADELAGLIWYTDNNEDVLTNLRATLSAATTPPGVEGPGEG